ncbi:hypothetical protein [Chitinophaga sp. Cy-1792]|uniref:hypothetical protein n=1 Tax=Chitinophaga sp. Cy-1792 TaxID=2608339 RepID=UPI00141DB78C|nr:hypothetical protein [Chitinophaga sp. Cy-1792]NIG56156.1 hypothetical protein [Chitinophaga sp. Cy-1792]
MRRFLKILCTITVTCLLYLQPARLCAATFQQQHPPVCISLPYIGDTVIPHLAPPPSRPPLGDTAVKSHNGLFRRLFEYGDSLRNRAFRDSLIRRMTRQNVPEPVPTNKDSAIVKSEAYFTPFAGKVIRDIHYKRVPVFGPSNINDTTFTTSMKLLKFANRLHYDSKEWMIRQNLFFREDQRLKPFDMADNERYLRSRPFIQDARIYVIPGDPMSDSVDIEVITKDVFEYGVDVSQVSASDIAARFYNNNLLGAGQGVAIGFNWRNNYSPVWNTEFRYSKSNIGGSFVDFAAGYSTLNNTNQLDSNVYEGSYYISFNRPQYRNSAKIVGGLTVANNFSINIHGYSDSLYRDYRYFIFDAWLGYNFINNYDHNGRSGRKPNVAVLARHYNLDFQRRPDQLEYKEDPVYNNHRYYILELQAYRLDYFKAHYFFGFGRTEDIPLGYNVNVATGWETWKDRRRIYSGTEWQKFWLTKHQGLFNTTVGIGTFWQNSKPEDAVIHARIEYYSKLLKILKGRFRQFIITDYLNSPNPFFYKPLNINMENGIWGFRGTTLNGYQRLNFSSETVYYSPLKILGFKFNFFTSLQASMISNNSPDLLNNPIYLGIGGGMRIRNENLSLNTLKLSAYYFPNMPPPGNKFKIEITTVVDFRFEISALRAPSFLSFR